MVFILEFLGTVAFAISGASTGVQKKMDIFGVSMLAMTTAVGGGILRDIILNVTPPAAFRNPVFTLTSIATGIIVFYIVRQHYNFYQRPWGDVRQHYNFYQRPWGEILLRTLDAVGLGLFTVIGVQAAFVHVSEANAYLAVFVGVITGVGGGILRDILAGNTPYVLVKHFYACASLIGAVICAVLWPYAGSVPSMLAGAIIIVVLRNMAAHYHWSLHAGWCDHHRCAEEHGSTLSLESSQNRLIMLMWKG